MARVNLATIINYDEGGVTLSSQHVGVHLNHDQIREFMRSHNFCAGRVYVIKTWYEMSSTTPAGASGDFHTAHSGFEL